MKKYFVNAIIILILVIIVRNIIPLSKPSITVTHNGKKIETSAWDYNWFPKNSGGNSGMFPNIPDIEKNMDATTVKKGGKIKFHFNTVMKQPRKTVSLRMVNKEEISLNMKNSQKIKTNYFYAPKEKGEYVYLIDGYWDGTHTSCYLIKINVE